MQGRRAHPAAERQQHIEAVVLGRQPELLEPGEIGPREAEFVQASRRRARRRQLQRNALLASLPLLIGATYGIGELGLPDSASPERKAQAQQLRCDGQADAGALARLLGGEERIEDLRHVLLADAFAVVRDGNLHETVVLSCAHRDLPPALTGVDRVVHKV